MLRFRPWLEDLENRLAPTTVNLGALADNTLYQVSSADGPQLSNGAGQHFFVGRTSQGSNDIRRGAIKFDLSGVPAGSTITSATLTLNMSMTTNGAQDVALHRALMDWGEGTSIAPRGEGDGGPATTGDLTWFFTFFNTLRWTTPGGDFVAAGSASTSVNNLGTYHWTGAGLIADVQQWVNNRATNFGWILTGDETTGHTSKRFDTAANTDPTVRPMLTVDFTAPASPVLTISKSHTGNFHAGDAADTYTVTVGNSGAGPTAGAVTVTDPLPAGLAPTAADSGVINGWSVSTSGQTVTATRSDALAGGANYPALTLTVSVAASAPASVTNTATVSGGGAANSPSASDPTTIVRGVTLTISKTHTGNFRQGDAADTYTVTVGNASTGPTAGPVTVTDALPVGLAPTAADSGTINGWSVSASGQNITATRSDALAGGASYPALTLTVSVAANAPTSVTNTATVSGGGATNPASASDPTTIGNGVTFTISKSHTGNFRQGDAADIYTVTVGNTGQGPTSGTVTVIDSFPTGLAPTAADNGVINGWSVSASGQTVTATRSDALASGASYPALTLTVGVAPDAPASVTNTATVSGGGAANPASASDVTSITPVARFAIAKSHTGNFSPGDPADTYVVTVSNIGAGPTDGSMVTVTDALPVGLTPTAADSGTRSGWTLATNGQMITATRSDVLAGGASYPVLTITVGVALDVARVVTNTVTVAGGGALSPASASDPTATAPVADLTISKSHTGNFRQGDAADLYTLTVTNIGAGPTVGTVTVTDSLPSGLAPTAADSGVINGWTVTAIGQSIAATRDDVLASGGTYAALTLTVSVSASAPASVTNMATVTGGGEVTPPASASDPTTILAGAALAISKSHTGDFHSGDNADTYTITVSNVGAGPTNGTPVSVTDTLPTGLSPTLADSGASNGWTVSFVGQTISATRSDVLASGASYPVLTVTVAVANDAPASVTNTATVAGGGETDTTHNTASDVTTITRPAALTITISHGGNFDAGSTASYTITMSNTGGTADGDAVTVTDLLPMGLTYAGSASASGWTITASGQTVTATRGDVLASGASYPGLTWTVSVASNSLGLFVDSATVSVGGKSGTVADVARGLTPRRRTADSPPAPPPSTTPPSTLVIDAIPQGGQANNNVVTQNSVPRNALAATPGPQQPSSPPATAVTNVIKQSGQPSGNLLSQNSVVGTAPPAPPQPAAPASTPLASAMTQIGQASGGSVRQNSASRTAPQAPPAPLQATAPAVIPMTNAITPSAQAHNGVLPQNPAPFVPKSRTEAAVIPPQSTSALSNIVANVPAHDDTPTAQPGAPGQAKGLHAPASGQSSIAFALGASVQHSNNVVSTNSQPDRGPCAAPSAVAATPALLQSPRRNSPEPLARRLFRLLFSKTKLHANVDPLGPEAAAVE